MPGPYGNGGSEEAPPELRARAAARRWGEAPGNGAETHPPPGDEDDAVNLR